MTSKKINNKKKQVYVDLLEEDKPIAGQKFVCVSFVSPEKIIKNKELYYFQEFLSVKLVWVTQLLIPKTE